MLKIIEDAFQESYCGECRKDVAVKCPFIERGKNCDEYESALNATFYACRKVLEHLQDAPVWHLAGELRDGVSDLTPRSKA